MYSSRLITAPSNQPVSLEAAKRHLAIEDDFTDFDDLIESLIKAATTVTEDYTQRGLVTQTWELVLDGFPCSNVIELPMAGPLVSITSIVYKDEYGENHTVSTDVYAADIDALPGRLYVKRLQSWPYVVLNNSSAVKIRYVVGQAYTAVPEIYKTAITYMVGRLFEDRGPESGKSTDQVVKNLLSSYRLYSAYPVVRGI
jgi:uncharacterized phiE125 gp8 family phage protein